MKSLDAKAIVQTAKDAGMKYIIITSQYQSIPMGVFEIRSPGKRVIFPSHCKPAAGAEESVRS